MVDCLRRSSESISLAVHVHPGAKRTEVAGVYGDALRIRLAAPAIDGRANTALCEFVAQQLGVAKSAVEVKCGRTSRRKLVTVVGGPPDSAARLLAVDGR